MFGSLVTPNISFTLEFSNVLTNSYCVMDLPPLIMMENKKQGVGFENKVGSF
jgi:hypothetical protein